MQIVYIDFETYYRKKDFALKTAKSTGEYIGTTQIQMMGWAIGDGDVSLAVGEEQIREVVNKIDWSKAAMCSHNTQFDARVLKERFGKIPAFYFDTLAMMRTLHWNQLVSGAKLGHLSKVLQSYGLSIEDKGSEIDEADGKYLFKFKGDIYYMHDQEITAEYLGNLNLTKTGKVKTGKAYKDPREVVANAIQFFKDFSQYCVTDVKICRAGFKVMSKQIPKQELLFQDMITRCALSPQLEMDVPMLRGALHKAQERMREAVNTVAHKWFFGRYDDAKDALLSTTKLALVLKAMGGMTQDEIDDYVATEGVYPDVPFVIPTKLSEKESANKGRPVYKYALAKKDPGMAELMENPYPDLQEVLACRKVAVYCNNYEIPRLQRFINEQEYSGEVGMPLKVSGAFTHRLGGCLTADTMVLSLTANGLVTEKPIVDVLISDLVWDGVEFVEHDGVVFSGYQEVISYDGVTGTPDHKVFISDTEAISLAEAARRGTPIVDCPTPPNWSNNTAQKISGSVDVSIRRPVYDILNAGSRKRFCANGKLVHNSVFNIQNLSSGRNEGQDATMRMSIIAKEGRVVVAADSSQIEARVLAFMANETIILDEFKNGVDPYCALAEKIYNIPYAEINAARKDENHPNHEVAKLQRQAGKAGRLGLGYLMGSKAFVDYAATLGVKLTQEESERIVQVYRTTYAKTKGFWELCGDVLKMMVAGEQGYFGGPDGRLFFFDGARTVAGRRQPGIRLPDGLWLDYTDLQMKERTYADGTKKWNYCYYGIDAGKPAWVWVYSGKITENLCQALAFSIMKWQAMNINKRYPIAFNVHDEWIVTTTAEDAEACKEFVVNEMRRLPDWAIGCPIDAEGAYAKRYGDC